MTRPKRDYVLAVQTAAYPLGNGRFAAESAFAAHLRMLQAGLAPSFDRLVVVAPTIPDAQYEASREVLEELSEERDHIAFVPAFDSSVTRWQFWTREAFPLWRRLGQAMSTASYVHSGIASDIWKPYLALLNLRAWLQRKPSTVVVDIDFRRTSQRYYALGAWSRKSYLVNRVLHDPFKHAQVWLAVRLSDLVLLKSPSMVSTFGGGRSNVRDFLDAAHSEKDVISDQDLERRLSSRQEPGRPLEAIYFGRLVPYKGIDYVIDAVARARALGAKVHLTLVGGGESLPALREQAASRGVEDAITFVDPVKYGPELFTLVDRADVAVAAPKVEDTPRAALDAMARGLPIVAFDIDYFRNLSEKSGAVALAQWPSPESLAEQLVKLQKDRAAVERMARKAVPFARSNTQEIWLRKRIDWTLEQCGP